jgi:hypothetical protein
VRLQVGVGFEVGNEDENVVGRCSVKRGKLRVFLDECWIIKRRDSSIVKSRIGVEKGVVLIQSLGIRKSLGATYGIRQR